MNSIQSRISSRRSLLLGAATAAVVVGLPAIVHAEAVLAVGQTRFRGVSVDTRRIAAAGLPNYADRIARLAEPVVASVFANRLAPGDAAAPRLIVEISSISMINSGTIRHVPFNSQDRDWISGAGQVVDAHGRVLRSAPIDTSSEAFDPGGDITSAESIRLQQLIRVLAEWIDRSV